MKPKYLHAAIIVLSLVFVASAFAQVEPAIEEPFLPEEPLMLDKEPLMSPEELQLLETIVLSDTGWSDPTVGTWDSDTKTGTLTQDLTESIRLVSDGITLDGAGHTIALAEEWYYGVLLGGRTGVTVKNINVQGGAQGIHLYESSGNALIGNTTSNNYYGIELRSHSDNNTLIGNTAMYGYTGINLSYSSGGNTLTGNTLTGYESAGIAIGQGGSNNTLTGNTATNSKYGIVVGGNSNGPLTGNFTSDNSYGIYLSGVSYQILTGNTAQNNLYYGIDLSYASYNTLTRNTIKYNGSGGLRVRSAWNNQIYNNNFIGNPTQAYNYPGSGNVFNLPNPEGGNYWSDWTSPDDNSDGFVDAPYVFFYGKDELPWTDMFPSPKQLPVAYAGLDQTVLVNESAIFDGSFSYDPDGTILSYNWDLGDTTQESGEIVSHAYNTVGTYIITLTVIDDDGAEDTDTATVTVRVNEPPVANAGSDQTAVEGETVQFDGSGSYDPDGTVVSYSWDFGDTTAPGSGEVVSHTYNTAGIYTITLTVTDNDGAADTGQATVTVIMNEPPVANAGPDQTVLVNESAMFDGSLSYDPDYPDGDIDSYNWDFGDTTQGSGLIDFHTYNNAGTYTVTLTVVDNNGAADTATATVRVLTPAEACEDLIATVESMNLQQGIENSFDVKLEAVQDALVAANAGVREDAVNKLEAFINAVEAQRGKVLTDEQANLLVNYANRIIEALSEPPASECPCGIPGCSCLPSCVPPCGSGGI